jgi:hypothetical protein
VPATPAVSHFEDHGVGARKSRNGDPGVADGWRVGREAPLARNDPLPRRCAVWNDDVTTTQLAAMEREHARLDTEWRAIGADLAAVTADAALAPLVPMVPRPCRRRAPPPRRTPRT